MPAEELVVLPGTFDVEEPWMLPSECRSVELVRSADGARPRLSTRLTICHDGECLMLHFSANDDRLVATYRNHDEPLWQEDVVEAFLAPERLTEYFELEVNPLGTLFDARIDSPHGTRQGMTGDLSWTANELFFAIRRRYETDGSFLTDTMMRIPFRSLGRATPLDGETWRANFFRIDRHPDRGDEFSAWRPTMKTPPDFHVAAAFGTLRFVL